MRWWGWCLIGLMLGAAAMYAFAAQRVQAAQARQAALVLELADSAAAFNAARAALVADLVGMDAANVALRQTADSARRAARAAEVSGARWQAKLAGARTAADSVPLLVRALVVCDSGAASWRAAAEADSIRADTTEALLARTRVALDSQVVLTARWRALAQVNPPPPTAKMPLLDIPWPKLFAGIGAATNGRDVTPGLVLAVGFAF